MAGGSGLSSPRSMIHELLESGSTLRFMIPVAAVAYRNPETNKIQVAGDERFAASAIRLAKLSDELEQKIKKADAEAAKKLSKKTKSKSSRQA